jgi:hypothetical protein
VLKGCSRKLSSCHLLYTIENIESIHEDSVDLWVPNWPPYMNGLGNSSLQCQDYIQKYYIVPQSKDKGEVHSETGLEGPRGGVEV